MQTHKTHGVVFVMLRMVMVIVVENVLFPFQFNSWEIVNS